MVRRGNRSVHVRLIKHLRETHRQLGMLLAFFMIFLALTGIMINHGNSLSLDRSKVEVNWILDHYNIEAPDKVLKFSLAKNKSALFVVGKQVWLANTLLFTADNDINSAAIWQQFIIISGDDNLRLYNHAGQLVDVMDKASGLPTNIQGLAVNGNNIYLQTAQGIFLSNDELYSWQLQSKDKALDNWSKASTISAAEIKHYQQLYRQQILSWERVVLDIHSGRFFASLGVLFMDLVALFIIILSLSGIYMWIRQARARH
ncbi:MAG: PepSY domain-containing protein [Thalassotalea sp.]|nr:PepSY domain-containing protein [Thalassotalea sp.]MDG2392579.1 PepSY domain-containing protein [Thalassotalea sp.]